MTTVPALSDEAAINQYTATSSQTDFNFTYMIFATADIKVYVNGTLKTETTHYTVKKSSGASIGATDLPLDGGKVVFVSGLALDDQVTLTRSIAIARLTGYSVAGAFRADVVNAEFTKGYAVSQQLRRDIERSIRLSAFDALGGTLTLPANRAGRLLAFDDSYNLVSPLDYDDIQAELTAIFAITDEIVIVAGIDTEVTTLAGISANITTVAGIASAVSTVAGISANVSTVSGISANVTTVAGLSASIASVVTNMTSIQNAASFGFPTLVSGDEYKMLQINAARTAYNAVEAVSRKNAIINGDFNIWQRGTSFAAAANSQYSADRWGYYKSGAMVHTLSRSTDVPTVAQAGRLYNYSLLVDCTTVDSSIGAGDLAMIRQVIEGYNFLPLAQKAFTISFWVKATKTGTYCCSFRNSGADRAYVAEYTINASDTWEYKTITVLPSPAAGTWDYTNGTGLFVEFSLATGSTYQAAAGSWQTGAYFATSNQVNACDDTANNFRITAVQLEVGSLPTPFEYRFYQQELNLCQRYFEEMATGANAEIFAVGANQSTTLNISGLKFRVKKRSAPSFTFSAASTFRILANTSIALTVISAGDISTEGCVISGTVASGLTAGDGGLLTHSGSGTASIQVSSEL
jgi:hypothetical protein